MLTAVTVGFLEIAGLQLPGIGWIVYAAGMLAWAVHAALSRG